MHTQNLVVLVTTAKKIVHTLLKTRRQIIKIKMGVHSVYSQKLRHCPSVDCLTHHPVVTGVQQPTLRAGALRMATRTMDLPIARRKELKEMMKGIYLPKVCYPREAAPKELTCT